MNLFCRGGRLYEQRNRAWELINDIPGVSCVKPRGALYMFPRIDAKRFNIHDDQKMVLDFLLQEKVLLVQGTAFNWPWPDHFRIVTLPREDDLEMAINRFGRFLSRLPSIILNSGYFGSLNCIFIPPPRTMKSAAVKTKGNL
ncbi:aminotransferase [Salmonella enterica subsp. enterica]|uniref:alanine transaminase n=1 Tax=Salmonella enterica I TaxID=59201 RepID=A0A447N746_SALET|nr:aminotransferase [Salmonella enterica subsp. enterica]